MNITVKIILNSENKIAFSTNKFLETHLKENFIIKLFPNNKIKAQTSSSTHIVHCNTKKYDTSLTIPFKPNLTNYFLCGLLTLNPYHPPRKRIC